MADYRWNLSDFAVAYDASAEHIHPRYLELQDAILAALPFAKDAEVTIVDAGGGSGRLMERILAGWPHARGIVVDQSEAFLALAERKLERFAERASCLQSHLQHDWFSLLPQPPAAIVSMSAIHHLDAAEKQTLYRRCCQALAPGGALLNGDEVRPASDADYLQQLEQWTAQMQRGLDSGLITPLFRDALDRFRERNITRFGQPKQSGDDCLETLDAQLVYLRQAGFAMADCPWQRDLWALLRGSK
jgi:SAM-dependent methyltransferase